MEDIKMVENINEEVVDQAVDKLTFGQTCATYAIGGLMITGAVTLGYLGYKGIKKVVSKSKQKKQNELETESENVIDVNDVEEVDESSNDK